MCLLIANPERKPIPMSVFETATESNPDGFGCSFIQDGKAIIKKGVDVTPEKQFALCEKYDWPQVLHWRFTTSGGTCGKFAHPFRLAPTTTLAHNGVLPWTPGKGLSDTATLVRALRKTPFEAVARLRKYNFKGNKFCVLNTKRLHIVGEEQGTWKDGVWYSNTTGFRSRYQHSNRISNWNSKDWMVDQDGKYHFVPDYDTTGDDERSLAHIDMAVETLSEEIEWELNAGTSDRTGVALRALQHSLDNYRLTRAV
jgi:hypothetical protein